MTPRPDNKEPDVRAVESRDVRTAESGTGEASHGRRPERESRPDTDLTNQELSRLVRVVTSRVGDNRNLVARDSMYDELRAIVEEWMLAREQQAREALERLTAAAYGYLGATEGLVYKGAQTTTVTVGAAMAELDDAANEAQALTAGRQEANG